MDTKELLKKVRAIEIKTRGLSKQIFSGEYHSAFKGRGMAFDENREYQAGDEIRTIDWNVTARMNHPYVKVFEEERELTAMILVDVSGSEKFGSAQTLKQQLITELCAVLAFSAIQNNDKIGVIFFTNKIEKFIPPKKGKTHILRIIRELLDFEPSNKETDISAALDFFSKVTKKRAICFVLSDFQDTEYERSLRIANSRHDIVALKISDPIEKDLNKVGWIQFHDLESNTIRMENSRLKKTRKKFSKEREVLDQEAIVSFKKSGVDYADITTGENYVKPLINLFNKRG